MQYTLIIEDRNGIIADELSFEQGSFIIGRTEGNDIQLPSRSVSRRHARLFTQGGRAFIEDLNSSNGVVVDGRRIMATTELGPGSQIRLGDYLLLVKVRRSPQEELAAARQAMPQESSPRLIRVGDEREGELYSITDVETSVGRTDDNFVVLKDSSVSRHHAKLVIDRGRMVVVDLGSSNGTRINGHLLREPAIINGGDLISFGNLRFIYANAGQQIDINDYRKQLTRSSRGLVIAVTILALLLVFVASSIGAFVILETRGEEDTVPQGTTRDRAQAAKQEGDRMVQEEQWDEAIARYTEALGYQPDFPEVQTALARAQAEREFLHILEAAEMNITNGTNMETQGNDIQAVLLYGRAREQLQQVSTNSAYFTRAYDRITLQIDPALLRLHRRLGESYAQTRRFTDAVSSYESAVQVWESLPEDRRPDVIDQIRANLWTVLVSAGDEAMNVEDWPAAVRYFERAQEIGELPRRVERRLRDARRRLP